MLIVFYRALLIIGIVFTMSTFIATLGFAGQAEQLQHAKTVMLIASIIAVMSCLLFENHTNKNTF